MVMESLVSFLTLVGGLQPNPPDSLEKGILIFPLEVNKKPVGEPGQVVAYSYLDSRKLYLTLTLNGATYNEVSRYHIIPYDSIFTPSRVYLFLSSDEKQIWTQDVVQEARFRYLLAKNTCSEFPFHPLHEDMFNLLCRYAAAYEAISTEGKETPMMSITVAKNYLREFPQGKFRDEVEWLLIQLTNHVYEYEGYASGPLQHLKAYESFLSHNPSTQMANQIKLEIARLCRTITESLADDLEKNVPDGFVKEDIPKFRLKALDIYRNLLESNDLKVRETARVAIYNIEHGRTVYVGGTDW